MDWYSLWMEIWHNNKGKIIGIIAALLFALFVISVGFWKTIFIFICILIGFYIGKKIDDKINIKESIEKLFKD